VAILASIEKADKKIIAITAQIKALKTKFVLFQLLCWAYNSLILGFSEVVPPRFQRS